MKSLEENSVQSGDSKMTTMGRKPGPSVEKSFRERAHLREARVCSRLDSEPINGPRESGRKIKASSYITTNDGNKVQFSKISCVLN